MFSTWLESFKSIRLVFRIILAFLVQLRTFKAYLCNLFPQKIYYSFTENYFFMHLVRQFFAEMPFCHVNIFLEYPGNKLPTGAWEVHLRKEFLPSLFFVSIFPPLILVFNKESPATPTILAPIHQGKEICSKYKFLTFAEDLF